MPGAREMSLDMIGRQVAGEVLRASPSLAAVLAAMIGIPLQSWVYIAAIVYTVAQTAYLVWRWAREWRGHRPH